MPHLNDSITIDSEATAVTAAVVNKTFLKFYEVSLPVYVVAVPAMICLCAAAILANLVILISVKSLKKQRLSLTLKFTYSLAGADAWSSLVILCGLVINSYIPHVLGKGKFYRQDCWVYGLEGFRLGGMLTSVLHLLCLASNHYLASAFPIKYHIISANKNANWLIVFIWIFPPIFYISIFLAYSQETFLSAACSNLFLEAPGFRTTVFTLIFVPLLVMICIYVLIGAILSKLHRELSSDSNAGQRQINFLKRKTKTFFTALLIVSTFLIGWVPSIALFALTCDTCPFPRGVLHENWPLLMVSLYVAVNVLIILKGLLNPLIYGLRIPETSKAVRLTYCFGLSTSFRDSIYKSAVGSTLNGSTSALHQQSPPPNGATTAAGVIVIASPRHGTRSAVVRPKIDDNRFVYLTKKPKGSSLFLEKNGMLFHA